jgi:hypothetical protein
MAKAEAVRSAAKSERKPFSSPSDDETIEILIPEGAESGKIPADDQYIGKLLGVVQEESRSSGNPMLTWTFTIHEGDFQGMDFTMWTPLTSNAMWKLADTLTALGVKWQAGTPLRFKAKDLKGTLVRLVIKDDTFQGREQSKLAAILPHPDGAGKKGGKGFTVPQKVDEDDEEEERPTRTRAARAGKPLPRDEDEEPEEEEEEEFPRARGRGKARKVEDDMEEVWGKGKKRRPVEEDEDEDEEERPARRGRAAREVEEDEDEEEERPRGRGRPAARGRGR